MPMRLRRTLMHGNGAMTFVLCSLCFVLISEQWLVTMIQCDAHPNASISTVCLWISEGRCGKPVVIVRRHPSGRGGERALGGAGPLAAARSSPPHTVYVWGCGDRPLDPPQRLAPDHPP